MIQNDLTRSKVYMYHRFVITPTARRPSVKCAFSETDKPINATFVGKRAIHFQMFLFLGWSKFFLYIFF